MERQSFELVMLRRPAEQDPSVKAGRLAVDVMEYWCPVGSMARPGCGFTIPDGGFRRSLGMRLP
jgi:hypothetical protein